VKPTCFGRGIHADLAVEWVQAHHQRLLSGGMIDEATRLALEELSPSLNRLQMCR